jgi:hypothetical protein
MAIMFLRCCPIHSEATVANLTMSFMSTTGEAVRAIQGTVDRDPQ